MGKIILLFIAALFSLLLLQSVKAGCCVIQNDACTYWNMDDWSLGRDFCNKLQLWGYGENTTWFDVAECAINFEQLPRECQNGFDVPEFNAITAGIALAGAGIGFMLLRRKR